MSQPFDYRYVLDEPKRRLIVALVANGSSRRVGASFVGCAPSTITRTAARDPDFAQQMAHAEQTAEISLLRSVQKASRMSKHWRAAAWLLERRNPEDFAVRHPNIVTEQQMADAINQIAEGINQDLPEENYRRTIQRLDAIMLEMRNLRGPISTVPIDDDGGTTTSTTNRVQNRNSSKPPHPLAQLTDATFPPEVEIDLRIEGAGCNRKSPQRLPPTGNARIQHDAS